MSPERRDLRAAQKWPIQRPRQVGLFVWGLSCAALFSLAYVSLYTVPIALYCLWRMRSHPHWGLLPSRGVLSIDDKGEWGLFMGDSFQPLVLVHAWPASAWLTLRFSRARPADRGRLEITLWKSCMPPRAWRWLCLRVVGGSRAPGHARAHARGPA